MSELLPCPLCGDKATRASGYVACDSCSAWAQVEDWNRRHAPGGWQMVPVEPTGRMQVAGLRQRYDEDGTRGVYRAMLAAAPTPGGE